MTKHFADHPLLCYMVHSVIVCCSTSALCADAGKISTACDDVLDNVQVEGILPIILLDYNGYKL